MTELAEEVEVVVVDEVTARTSVTRVSVRQLQPKPGTQRAEEEEEVEEEGVEPVTYPDYPQEITILHVEGQ